MTEGDAMSRDDATLDRMRHEALQRVRPRSSEPTDEDLAAFLDGTIEDEAIRARILGEVGTDPVITSAVVHGGAVGGEFRSDTTVARTGGRLGWRIAWAVAAVLAVTTTVGYLDRPAPTPSGQGRVELLDDQAPGSAESSTGTGRASAQDAVWMFLAWMLLLGMTVPAWWPFPRIPTRNSHA